MCAQEHLFTLLTYREVMCQRIPMASEVLQLIHINIQYLIRRSLSGVTAESDCSATELQLPPATTPHRVHTVHVYVL